MIPVLVGFVFILAGMLWYPIGYAIIDSIKSQPVWWVDFILSYKNQECWLLIISGLFLLSWSIRLGNHA